MQKIICLEYHDIVPDNDFSSSGFDGAGADMYKMGRTLFEAHLQEFGDAKAKFTVQPELEENRTPLLMTFDDGGVGAISEAAELLATYGVKAYFLIATGRIQTDGFLSKEQITNLEGQGHVIGAHTDSHPLRMASLSTEKIDEEWRVSTAKLAEITGRETIVASISGGQYSREVAELAAANGIRLLFTSEPVTRCFRVDGCLVVGRYTFKRNTPASFAAAIANGNLSPRLQQWASWNAKKAAKAIAGNHYLKIRRLLLGSGA